METECSNGEKLISLLIVVGSAVLGGVAAKMLQGVELKVP